MTAKRIVIADSNKVPLTHVTRRDGTQMERTGASSTLQMIAET